MMNFSIAKNIKWIILAIVLGTGYLFINAVDYLDLPNFCYIRINTEPLNGNRKTISAAILKLKKTDRNAYRNTCKYVKRISEGYCDLLHLHSPKNAPWHKADGCYILCSKTIYLKPIESDNSEVVIDRSNLIKKFSQDSKEFWEKK